MGVSLYEACQTVTIPEAEKRVRVAELSVQINAGFVVDAFDKGEVGMFAFHIEHLRRSITEETRASDELARLRDEAIAAASGPREAVG